MRPCSEDGSIAKPRRGHKDSQSHLSRGRLNRVPGIGVEPKPFSLFRVLSVLYQRVRIPRDWVVWSWLGAAVAPSPQPLSPGARGAMRSGVSASQRKPLGPCTRETKRSFASPRISTLIDPSLGRSVWRCIRRCLIAEVTELEFPVQQNIEPLSPGGRGVGERGRGHGRGDTGRSEPRPARRLLCLKQASTELGVNWMK